jgi:transposase
MLEDPAMASKRVGKRLSVLYPDCAGVDVGKKKHFVAVDPSRSESAVRSFDTFTDDLEDLAGWLKACGVKVVAMESTGVYWIALYEVLDRAGFEVRLVNPRATKQVSGRKSDVLDCQWIWQLMSYGLLDGAFRPSDEICELRSYARQRARLTRDAARSVQHIQKALTEMNVQLDSVLSDIMGQTGQRILRAIVAGERDGERLGSLRHSRVKADVATIARSLRGNWRAEHLFALEQALARYDFLLAQSAACEQKISTLVERLSDSQFSEAVTLAKPSRNLPERTLQMALSRLMGVDLTAIPTIGVETALAVACEVGPDFSRFPSCGHFCSWLNLAPGTRISGGHVLPGRSPKRTNPLGQALRLAAVSARHNNSFIGAAHRSRLARLDKGRAIKATAHQLARLIYAMVTRGEAYVEKGIETFEHERRVKQLTALRRNAKRLGFDVFETPNKTAA